MSEVSALLLRLYTLARETRVTEFRDRAVELVRPVLAFDSATWAAGMMGPGGFDFHTVHLHREAADRLERYEHVKDQDHAGTTALKLMGRTLNLHVPTFFGERARAGMRAYAAAVGHQNALIWSSRNDSSGLIQWISMYRSDVDRQFSEYERQLCDSLTPHLIEAQAANRAIQLPQAPGGATRTRWQTAIADCRGVLHHANAGFGAVLRAEWPQCEEWKLPAPLFDALLAGRVRYCGKSILVVMLKLEDLLFLKAREKIPADDLTSRERVVAAHLASGLTHKEIARALDISPATARNHTQAIYRRLDVHNKAELATRLRELDE